MPTTPRFPGRISDWILHKDNQVIAFNKPAGLNVQPDKTGDQSLLGMGAAYARHDLYLIHRLDRPVSGVVVLGQKPSAQTALTKQLQKGSVEKIYLAVVADRPEADEAELVHHLSNAPGNRSAASLEPGTNSREARLSYRYLGSSDRYHLLEVKLKTGRKHQIRSQLAAIGSPIRGDKKYGFKRSNEDGTIDLHGASFSYDHPVTGERVTHTAPAPATPVWEAFQSILVDK
ncbi:RluA family pseudouridine synthase [Neolewinella antarctica]|uniref:23S rRNA pseudouridine1911/1915/1917 synthase n=1 Tax=Neolewinella antarctica TaxID=442734 RepID=A0ABX0XGB8_9BACT|nr:RluA family pseudouridine synthase [Neolewinella antarctica]NJC28252.1 23S rRNA pseudouridine1911/1915/1917 synthase [Neolewinella antarctica]